MENIVKQLNAIAVEMSTDRMDSEAEWRVALIGRAVEAMKRAFPQDHTYRREVSRVFSIAQKALEQADGGYEHSLSLKIRSAFSTAYNMTCAALDDYRNGYIREITRAVEMKTVEDILDQAKQLVEADQLAASAVLAGGAFETHLRALVEHAGIAIKGAGSINAYDSAIRDKTNRGKVPKYDKQAGKDAAALGGMRNEAAHNPSDFEKKYSTDSVQNMIDRVRLFIRSYQ